MATVEANDSDNLMPNDGTYIGAETNTAAVEQTEAEARAKIIGAQPLLKDLFEWLDTVISSADSLTNLNLEAKSDIASQVQAMQIVSQTFIAKKGELLDMVRQWGVHYDGEPIE